MSSSKKKQTVGYRYRVGMHIGLCEGPVDALLQLRSAERVAWSGNVTSNSTITVDAPGLFGGDEREGGLAGGVDVMMGGSAQTANTYLSGIQGTPQPAYRGLLGLVFKAFYWGNSPYLKPVAALVRRVTSGWDGEATAWYPEKAVIPLGVSVAGAGAAFAEDFGSWPQAYTITDPTFFSTVSTPYGTGLRLTNLADTTEDGLAYRDIASAAYTQISLKARVDTNVAGDTAGDADIVFVQFAQGSTVGLSITLSRDATGTGSNERAEINGSFVGSSPLTVGDWYLFECEVNWGAGTVAYSVSNLTTPGVLGTGSVSLIGSVTAFDRVQIAGDIVAGERRDDAGTVADIRLNVASEIVGMNPAHIIYECLTNTEWGAGNGTGLIDDTQFRAAADTFYAEGLGLCLHWARQEQIEKFQQVVIDHAGANLVQHPRTGLFQIKPLRGGYDPSSLPLLDPSNIVALESFERPSPDEAVNEVAVTYTDVAAGPGKKATVKAQNLAAIMAAGGAVITRKKDYPGFVTPGLGMRAAMRDLRASSTPLARARVRVNRAAYTFVDGDVVRLTWPKLGITTLAMRVLRVNYGSLTDGTMTLELAEDVFGLPAATYAAQQPSGWESPSAAPTVAANRLVREANYYEAQRVLGSAAAQALDPTTGYVIAAAARAGGAAFDFGMRTRTGSAAFEEQDRSAFAPSGTLSASLSHTATSATLTGLTDAGLIQVGRYAQIDSEIVRIDTFDSGTGAVTMGRGALGTVAATHASGARVWFVDQFFAVDGTERIDGEAVDVKLTPRTGRGELSADAAPTDVVTLDQIIARPYAPGRLRIAGEAYPTTVEEGPVTISWAHRHRTQQNLEGDESGNIGPEDGVTYSLEVSDADTDEILVSVDGIAGTSYNVADGVIASGMNVRVRLWAERTVNAAALASAQRHDYVVTVGTVPPVASAWNPADKDADVTLTGSDLIATVVSAGWTEGAARGVTGRAVGSGNWFFALEYTGPDGRCCPGVATAAASLNSYPGEHAQSWGYYGVDGRSQNNGGSSAYGDTYGNGAIVGIGVNTAGDLTFWLWTGSAWDSQGVAYSGLTGTLYPCWGPGSSASGTRSVEMLAMAPPSGYRSWA